MCSPTAPIARARQPQPSAVGYTNASEPRQEQNPCSHRACVRSAAEFGRIVRTIGIMRARAKIGLQNLAYNMRRLVTLERMAAA